MPEVEDSVGLQPIRSDRKSQEVSFTRISPTVNPDNKIFDVENFEYSSDDDAEQVDSPPIFGDSDINLIDPERRPPDAILALIKEVAHRRGLMEGSCQAIAISNRFSVTWLAMAQPVMSLGVLGGAVALRGARCAYLDYVGPTTENKASFTNISLKSLGKIACGLGTLYAAIYMAMNETELEDQESWGNLALTLVTTFVSTLLLTVPQYHLAKADIERHNDSVAPNTPRRACNDLRESLPMVLSGVCPMVFSVLGGMINKFGTAAGPIEGARLASAGYLAIIVQLLTRDFVQNLLFLGAEDQLHHAVPLKAKDLHTMLKEIAPTAARDMTATLVVTMGLRWVGPAVIKQATNCNWEIMLGVNAAFALALSPLSEYYDGLQWVEKLSHKTLMEDGKAMNLVKGKGFIQAAKSNLRQLVAPPEPNLDLKSAMLQNFVHNPTPKQHFATRNAKRAMLAQFVLVSDQLSQLASIGTISQTGSGNAQLSWIVGGFSYGVGLLTNFWAELKLPPWTAKRFRRRPVILKHLALTSEDRESIKLRISSSRKSKSNFPQSKTPSRLGSIQNLSPSVKSSPKDDKALPGRVDSPWKTVSGPKAEFELSDPATVTIHRHVTENLPSETCQDRTVLAPEDMQNSLPADESQEPDDGSTPVHWTPVKSIPAKLSALPDQSGTAPPHSPP